MDVLCIKMKTFDPDHLNLRGRETILPEYEVWTKRVRKTKMIFLALGTLTHVVPSSR